MKRIIYSIVAALILSVILSLTFPTWFLNEDACYTYLNNTARMDISISGNVRNGRVRAESANTEITQPKWLSDDNFQGTMVVFPVSYRENSYQLKLTSLADAASQDATLIIKSPVNVVRHNGKSMPAGVVFRNVTLNGKPKVAGEIVWHDQPLRLQLPFHPSESITLAFDVLKPLKATDFSFVHILVIFLASLSIGLFLPFLRTQPSNFMSARNRIYFVEYLRIFLIFSIFLCHIVGRVDTDLERVLLEFFHTKAWRPWYAVEIFFIIGGFFMYGRIVRRTMHARSQEADEYPPPVTSNLLASVGRLWLRLMPGIIFCHALLVVLGVRNWCDFAFCFFPTGGYGIATEVVGNADWFIGVYFLTACLFMGLFAYSREGAWLKICMLVLLCGCLKMNLKPSMEIIPRSGGMYYGFLAHNVTRGISCMGLGLVAAALSRHWHPREGLLLRLVATAVEVLGLFMLFNYMYRSSWVFHYSPIAVELTVAALLISAAHSWGYISAFLNRFGGIMYVSRYTYSLLLVQGVLVSYFRFYNNFGINPRHCTIIIFCLAIPLVLIEYHLIEKWLTPIIKKALTRE